MNTLLRSTTQARLASSVRRFAVFGAAPDTRNMGVSALLTSLLCALGERLPEGLPVIFDYGDGVRPGSYTRAGRSLDVLYCGARAGHRYYRGDNLRTMAIAARLGVLGRALAPLQLLDSCSAVLDASAGDSFSDIYGQARFDSILLPKQISKERSVPLVLLPQTYGPFGSPKNRESARRAILYADAAWAGDPYSYALLEELLGGEFDPSIHRSGVDMAFGLPSSQPSSAIVDEVESWLEAPGSRVGLNVSGLVWNSSNSDRSAFGIRADYRALVVDFICWLLDESDATILLVPHVLAERGSVESDEDAADAVLRLVSERRPNEFGRLRTLPALSDETQLKWIISHCSWFCGTRMHATIAALSSGVPVANIVYSDKARGVFATCGQQDRIVDPRERDTAACIEALKLCFLERDQAAETLAAALVEVQASLKVQMDHIASFVGGASSRSAGARY